MRFGRFVRAIFARDRGFSYGPGERTPRPLGVCQKAGFVYALGLVRRQWSAFVKVFRRQVSGDPQATLPAQRTRVAVERGGAFGIGGGLRRLLRAVDRRPDLLDARGAAAVGEKAEMANTHEALGQDMKEKAADKLLPCEGQNFVATAVAVVLVVELHLRLRVRASLKAMRWL